MRSGRLRESLQQQTATADVLKVISRSVFEYGEPLIEKLCHRNWLRVLGQTWGKAQTA
jgi:microsomal dipeptidase-like Zn-dependent dipeptidase